MKSNILNGMLVLSKDVGDGSVVGFFRRDDIPGYVYCFLEYSPELRERYDSFGFGFTLTDEEIKELLPAAIMNAFESRKLMIEAGEA